MTSPERRKLQSMAEILATIRAIIGANDKPRPTPDPERPRRPQSMAEILAAIRAIIRQG